MQSMSKLKLFNVKKILRKDAMAKLQSALHTIFGMNYKIILMIFLSIKI